MARSPFGTIKRSARRLGAAGIAELRSVGRRGTLAAGSVLYESFAGNGALCNPEALFRELLAADDLSRLTHIWVLDGRQGTRDIEKEFALDRRVRFVRFRSLAYFTALATSEYLINNATFPPEFSKKKGQIYLNTWHGTPLKHMGYTMPNGAMDSANTLRNFVSADFLLSQNPFMTEQMYSTDYKLKGIFRGTVIEEGYPRVDRQFLDASEGQIARNRLESAGVQLGGRSIVLYAPTWKGGSFSNPQDDARALVDATIALQELLGAERYVVLLKTHQVVHAFAARNPDYAKLLIPNDIPTNTVLGLSDVLITDYSSIFFDFLALARPIIFYTPDLDDYTEDRGTYFAPDELPGAVCLTLDEVASVLLAGTDSSPSAAALSKAADWRSRFTPRDDGSAARRVVDIVFRGVTADRALVSLPDDDRRSLLLHLGGMRSNGITTSALNLLNSIDHDRFDVSVILGRPRGGQQLSNQARINPAVRQFHRIGGMNGSKVLHARRRLGELVIRTSRPPESDGQKHMWREEWARCFGDSRFDSVIDFSGYTAFWASLLLHSPVAFRSIWMHNDMLSETGRLIRNRRRMRRTLPAVFVLYCEFDALISVSPSLADLNRAQLAPVYSLPGERFRSARNLVDGQHVIDGLAVALNDLPEHELPEDELPVDDRTADDLPADDLRQTAPPLITQSTVRAADEPDWMSELKEKNETVWFVTVGRFSTEKNQARLLRAFARVYEQNRSTRLLIVGYGPLRDELDRLVVSLGLTGVAWLVGPYSNPFPILAAADCFVLSSDYEGQPMVLLEAAIASLPIVSVDFASVRDALPGSAIHVVAQTDEALAAGMLDFLSGSVGDAFLDIVAYNREAVAEFHRATSKAG